MQWNETVIDDVRFHYQPAGQESGLVSQPPPPLEGEEITRRERKRRPLRAQSGFPLNLSAVGGGGTAALCFLCGQPAATGTPCHAGAGTLVYI